MKVFFGDRVILSRLIGPGREIKLNDSIIKKGFLLVVVGDNSSTFNLFFIQNRKPIMLGDNFIVLQGDHKLTLKDKNLLLSYDEVGKFITVFQSENMYSTLLNAVGKTNFFSCLKKLREYNYLNRVNPEKGLTKGFEKNIILKSAFNNKDLRYLSEKGYDRFFSKVVRNEEMNDIKALDVKVPLKGNGDLSLEFDFQSSGLTGSDLFALIGKNGVGKSQSLKAIKSFSLKTNLFKKVIDINLFMSVNTTASPQQVSLRIDSSSKINSILALKNLIEKRQRYSYFDAVTLLKEFCNIDLNCTQVQLTMLDGSKENFWSKNIDSNFIDTEGSLEFIRNGKNIFLSSGQSYLLNLMLVLLLHIESHSLVLIDEPESYLHPNLIKKSYSVLQTLLKSTYSKAIISTHSIFFIREMPREYVKIISSQNGASFCRIPMKETFGASLDRLADEIFYDDEYDSSFVNFAKKFKKDHKNIKLGDVRHLPTSLAARILADD